MNKTSDITASMAHMAIRNQERFQGLQTVVTLMQKDGKYHNWHPMIGYYILQKLIDIDLFGRSYRGYFNYIAFDFIPGQNLMEIVKISQRTKTTSFRNHTSLN